MLMITKITFEKIYQIWDNFLWPSRVSKIEPNSAMMYLGGYTLENMSTVPSYFGYFINNQLVGVNSGHKCSDNSYRSRGIFVFPEYRKLGIATQLLKETIKQGDLEKCSFVWSYPRKTGWKAYELAGFRLTSDWEMCETSDANAYCRIDL